MKRIIRSIVGPFWRLTGPLRRPLMARLALRQRQAVSEVVRDEVHPHLGTLSDAMGRVEALGRERFGAIEHAINVTRCTHDALAADTNLALDSLVREIARLQRQVEVLQQVVEEAASGRDGLALVSGPEHDAA